MQTNFDTWLQALAAGGKGGSAVVLKTATRGLVWSDVIVIDGNWLTATLEGSISAAPDAASVLANVIVNSPSYDGSDDVTLWTVSLAAGTGSNSTGSLPTDTDGDGVEYLPIAFYLTPSGGSKELLFGTAFPLIGKV